MALTTCPKATSAGPGSAPPACWPSAPARPHTTAPQSRLPCTCPTRSNLNPWEGGCTCFALFYSLSLCLSLSCDVAGDALLGSAGLSWRHLWLGLGRSKKGGEAVCSACFVMAASQPCHLSHLPLSPAPRPDLPSLLGSLGVGGYGGPRASELSFKSLCVLGEDGAGRQ